MIKNVLYAYIFLLLSHAVYAMQEIEHVKMFSQYEIVLRLVFSDYLTDHQTVCSVAETNRSFHAWILNIAKNKQYSMIRCPDYRYTLVNFVHKYGTASHFVYLDPLDSSILKLCYFEFGDKIQKLQRFNRFIAPLPC